MFQQNLQLAMQLHRAGELVKAEALYLQILQQKPRHPEVLFLLGGIAAQRGLYERAVDLMKSAINISGGIPGYYCELGVVLEILNRFDEAESSYRKALAQEPDFSPALVNLYQLLRRRTDISHELLECYIQISTGFLSRGHVAAAEICCREVLDLDSSNLRALNTLTAIYEKAELSPNLHGFERDRPQRIGTGTRYLLIKSWGFGFWSDVSSVLGALLLAEVTNRIPVIHWGSNSLFRDDSSRDAFGLYFEPVSSISRRDLELLSHATCFPPKWNQSNLSQENFAKWEGPHSRLAPLHYIDRMETIAVCDFFVNVIDVIPWIPASHPMHGQRVSRVLRWLIDKYLKPRPHILKQVDAFYRPYLAGSPFVAIHLRGSDKAREVEANTMETINRSSMHRLEEVDPSWNIFLLTDDEHWLQIMKHQFGKRIVTAPCKRSSTTQGVHYLAEGQDRQRVATEVMVDTYIALRANRFIGNGWSTVSGMISVMKDWAPGDCVLEGDHQLEQRNLIIYV